jgi:hypothetical protein
MLRILQQIQRLDAKVNHRILELKEGRGRGSFELRNGVLVHCPPVFETFSRVNLRGDIRKVVLPAALVKEYMAAVHIQSGHTGIANLVARTRRNVYFLEEKAFTRLAREVCEQCEGCSRTKSGSPHALRADPAAGRARAIHWCRHNSRMRGFPRVERTPEDPVCALGHLSPGGIHGAARDP